MAKLKHSPAMTSQRKVGTASTRRIGRSTFSCETCTLSAAPRLGSLMKNMKTARISPGTAAMKKGARQLSKALTMAPMVKNASSRPKGRPSMKMPMARARRWAGNKSPISEFAAGA
ncbi:hypothetical protein D3C87_1334490 [compost metagenome]